MGPVLLGVPTRWVSDAVALDPAAELPDPQRPDERGHDDAGRGGDEEGHRERCLAVPPEERNMDVVGVLRDVTGGYALGFWCLTVAGFGLVAVVPFLRPSLDLLDRAPLSRE